MGNTPGGPLSGGMEAQQAWANETIRENAAQRQQPAQEAQSAAPPTATPSVQEYNDLVAERNARERAERLQALNAAAQDLAPKETPNQDQQLQQQQQQQRGGPEM